MPTSEKGAIKNIGGLKGKSIPTPPDTSIIAFVNFKGGVGKTTCAVNVAGCLAYNFHKKVLLVDLDVQASLSQWLMGPQQWHNWSKHRKKTTYQIFLDLIQGSHAWGIATSTWSPDGCPNLFVCPATFDMLDLDTRLHYELNKPIHPRPFQCLDIQIKKICSQFDYVIFDCPPNMYMTTKNAIFCADHILIPTWPDFLSTTGLKKLVGFLKDLREQFLLYDASPARIAGIVINMFDAKKITWLDDINDLDAYVEQSKHESHVYLEKAKVFQRKVKNLIAVSKAQDKHLPVAMAFPTSEATKDFVLLTQQIMEVL